MAGCGENRTDPLPLIESGRFAATRGGVGVFVDLRGDDVFTRRLTEALARQPGPWSVGIVSIVNRSEELLEIPELKLTLPDRRVVPFERADRATAAALAELPEAGRYVPAGSALTIYVIAPHDVDDIRRVQMRMGLEAPVRLTPREAAPPPTTTG